MSAKVGSVEEYLRELERSKKGKPDQIREALDVYIELWRKTIEKGVVSGTDGIDEALAKIDRAGGLYTAASD